MRNYLYKTMLVDGKVEIKAVHENDLPSLLKKYDKLDDFEGGKLKC